MIALFADPPAVRDRLVRKLTAAGHEILHCDTLDAIRDAVPATEAASGLSQHFLRMFGRRPREIERSDRRSWFERFERELVEPLIAAEPKS